MALPQAAPPTKAGATAAAKGKSKPPPAKKARLEASQAAARADASGLGLVRQLVRDCMAQAADDASPGLAGSLQHPAGGGSNSSSSGASGHAGLDALLSALEHAPGCSGLAAQARALAHLRRPASSSPTANRASCAEPGSLVAAQQQLADLVQQHAAAPPGLQACQPQQVPGRGHQPGLDSAAAQYAGQPQGRWQRAEGWQACALGCLPDVRAPSGRLPSFALGPGQPGRRCCPGACCAVAGPEHRG